MLNSRRNTLLLSLTIAVVMLAACGAPAAPAATATSPPTITPTEGIPEDAYPEIPRVLLEEAKAAYDDGSAIFVDVRGERGDYDLAHIPGAIYIPFYEIDERLGELDKEKWIITYCV